MNVAIATDNRLAMFTRALESPALRVPPRNTGQNKTTRRSSFPTKIIKRMQAAVLKPFLQDVPIDRLRHDDKHMFVQEGYGGARIDANPTYRFFRDHVHGRVDDARAGFEQFYAEQFARYAFLSKGKGGMFQGSLYREVVRAHRAAGVELDRDRPRFRDDLVAAAIRRRVEQRFDLLRRISDEGYRPSIADPVIGVLRDDHTIRIEGGAHRAAALHALERDVMPGVLVVSPRTKRILETLKVIR